jgi:hypothetical protein
MKLFLSLDKLGNEIPVVSNKVRNLGTEGPVLKVSSIIIKIYDVNKFQ